MHPLLLRYAPAHYDPGAVFAEARNARAARRESEAGRGSAAVVRDAYDAVLMHDLEERILVGNPEAERMYGWSETEAPTINILHRPADEARP